MTDPIESVSDSALKQEIDTHSLLRFVAVAMITAACITIGMDISDAIGPELKGMQWTGFIGRVGVIGVGVALWLRLRTRGQQVRAELARRSAAA